MLSYTFLKHCGNMNKESEEVSKLCGCEICIVHFRTSTDNKSTPRYYYNSLPINNNLKIPRIMLKVMF